MKKLLLIFTIISIISCTKEEEEPLKIIHPLSNTNWARAHTTITGVNQSDLLEFTEDTLFEYVADSDLIIVSTYKLSENMIHIRNIYDIKWGNKRMLDSRYCHCCIFNISNDSLYFNGVFKGKKYN